MLKVLLATASIAAISVSAAAAADLGPMPTKALPVIAAPGSWSGAYVGLNAGYAWGNVDGSAVPNDALSDPHAFGHFTAPSFSPEGFIGGGQIGYNWQTGAWVLGGEVDFSGINAKSDKVVEPFFAGKGHKATTSSQYDWLFTARLRAGVTVAQNWLVYATGGLAMTRVKESMTTSGFFGNDTTTWSDSKTLFGGTIGGGVEYAFASNWSAKAEYLYAKFEDTTPLVTASTTGIGFGLAIRGPVASFSHDLNVVRVGINYKFGG
jgi:outer membrane immunogenic protein